MATIEQVQKGFVRMVDTQIAVAFEGWQKAIVAGAGGLLAANIPSLVKQYANHPYVAMLGVYNAESGTVNIDRLYEAFVPKLGEDKIPITIPKIGTIKLGKQEFDMLRQYIREA